MSQDKFLPFPIVLPQGKFQFGDMVQYYFNASSAKDRYYQQGVVFGSQYQHADFGLSDAPVNRVGWVHYVIWFYESGTSTACPFASYVHEDDLQLVKRSGQSSNVIHFPHQVAVMQRAQKHQGLLESIGGSSKSIVAVTLHDANEGFRYLDIYAQLPERLNKPRHLVIGQPANFVDPRIAEPRIHYLKRALANGQYQRYTYTYSDSHFWRFNVTVAPIYGSEEVLTIVEDAEDWQGGYWVNRITD